MLDQGLPRQSRLRTPADFAVLGRGSKHVAGSAFLIRHTPSIQHLSRLGLAVSRRVSRRAVQRNRIKRQVRECFRHHRMSLPDIDILVIARQGAAERDNALLRAELESLFNRLTRIKLTP